MSAQKAVRNIRAQHKQRVPSFLGYSISWDVSTQVLWAVSTQGLWDGRTHLPLISLEVALCF